MSVLQLVKLLWKPVAKSVPFQWKRVLTIIGLAAAYVTLIVQIEDKSGLENIDDILSVPGVDMVATGKNDLSQALGFSGQNSHPDVLAAEDLVIRKALEHGKYPTLLVKNKKRIKELKEKGVLCFSLARDESLLFSAMKDKLAELKEE